MIRLDRLTINLDGLTINPYGVEVFTDLERGKEFTVLLYRRKAGSLAGALAFISEVLADIARADFSVAASVKVQLSPVGDAKAPLSPTGELFRCHLTVPIEEST